MAAYRVIVPAVQVAAGSRLHFVERGAVLPGEVDGAVIDRLLVKGMIEKAESGDSESGGDELKPLDKMTREELDAYAAEHSIDIGAASNKSDVLAAIKAAESAAG